MTKAKHRFGSNCTLYLAGAVLLTISFSPLLNNVEMACNVVHVVLKKVAVVVRQTSKGEGND